MKHKKEIALNLICKFIPEPSLTFIGEGNSAIVYRDEHHIYKVYLFDNLDSTNYKRFNIGNVKFLKDKFEKSIFFYPIKQIIEINDLNFILTYQHHESEPCTYFAENEIQEFLVECWQKRLIFQDIKPSNFIRVNGNLKWIDYEIDNYTDNLFLNMIARGFIYTKYSNESELFLKKLCRSAINQFDIPELIGLQEFTNAVFSKIIYNESINSFTSKQLENFSNIEDLSEIKGEGNYMLPFKNNFNPEKYFWIFANKQLFLERVDFDSVILDCDNQFVSKNLTLSLKKITPPNQNVSLIIKACVQDAEILYEAVKHIARQLIFPNSFSERILALDLRETDFLREYNSNNTWEHLIGQAQRLLDDLVIDKIVFPSQKDIVSINKEWLGTEEYQTHTEKKVPVTAQLFAFEKAQNDYILQIDCDAIIGRLSKEHSFLNDMIAEMERNNSVLSVGFNIYKGNQQLFTNYYGFENGGFVPEVRFCLLKKSRIKSLLPLKNELSINGFKLSWYRSLELMQKEKGFCSIRGGDSRSFFIHPQNFKKTDKDVWFTTLDRVEQLHIVNQQKDEFDLTGSFYDWTIPKRNENLVIVSCFRNISLEKFLRYWYSLTSQSLKDWGLILIDDCSDNGINHFIREAIKEQQEKVTFIQNRFRVGLAQNTYKAIHYFMQNQDSIVCILDADDALLGNDSLKNIYEKYTVCDADVVIGKMYRTDKLQAHYKYTPNFINPRLYGGNVWQHIRSFKKYLYDSLDFNDLKIENKNLYPESILLSKRFIAGMKFPEYCSDYSYMIPIVEMSENPHWINHFNIFHDRTTINTVEVKSIKENIIAQILAKQKKSTQNVIKGRKPFLPNLNKIEIDITYECNLNCINCNRSCSQAPTKEEMTLDQIKQFINDSVELNKKWELINLLGGEPSLHQNFHHIVELILLEYIDKHSPSTILQITSNGHGKFVQEQLNKLPKHPSLIIDYPSFKHHKIVSYFSPFNDAPIDSSKSNHKEYHKGCWVTSYCGIGLNKFGYYPCGVAGGIDRVFKFELGIKSLQNVDEAIAKLLDKFCRYCGNFSDYEQNFGNFMPRHEKATLNKPMISESWKQAYRKYNEE